MFNSQHKKFDEILTINDYQNASPEELRLFMQTGVCYIKVTSTTGASISSLHSNAERFFALSDEAKKRHSVEISATEQGKIDKITSEGYFDRRSNLVNFETYRQRIGDPLLPLLSDHLQDVEVIKNEVIDSLISTLVYKIAKELNIDEDAEENFLRMTKGAKTWLQITHYACRTKYEKLIRKEDLLPHNDISLITIIFQGKPGLIYWKNGKWESIQPKQGYAVAMLGSLFYAISEKMIKSPLHAVQDVDSSRLSTVLFFAGLAASPVYSKTNIKLGDSVVNFGDNLHKQAVARRQLMEPFCRKVHFGLNLFLTPVLISLISSELLFNNTYLSLFDKLKFFLQLAAALNLSFYVFKNTYLNRMYLDYLQYHEKPEYLDDEPKQAYALGESSAGFFGFLRSCIEPVTYEHRSLWNAGLLSSRLNKPS